MAHILRVEHGAFEYPEEQEDFNTTFAEEVVGPTRRTLWGTLAYAAQFAVALSLSSDKNVLTLFIADGDTTINPPSRTLFLSFNPEDDLGSSPGPLPPDDNDPDPAPGRTSV